MSINHVELVGNLTRSPELRSTASGTPVLSFGIAVNDSRRNASGQWEEVPNFFECSTFGNRATSLSDILTRGMKVAITGKLRYSSWEKDGKKHSRVDIIAREIELMQNRKPQQQGYQPQRQAQPEPKWNARQAYAEAPQPEFHDDDLPF